MHRLSTSPTRSRLKARIRQRGTEPELLVRRIAVPGGTIVAVEAPGVVVPGGAEGVAARRRGSA
jgi:hypothetical protein